MRRGQISIELLIVSSILLVIFLILLNVVSTKNNVSLAMSKQFVVQEVGYLASSAVNEAYLGGHNTNKTIFLPSKIRTSLDYNITITTDKNLRLNFDNKYLAFPLLTKNITGSFSTGSWNQILNNRGIIEIG